MVLAEIEHGGTEGALRAYEAMMPSESPQAAAIQAAVYPLRVNHKVPESELHENEIIPKGLEGYETDVEEIGIVTAQF